jgi:hypothetical protein
MSLSSSSSTLAFERMQQSRRLKDYFDERARREELLRSMPRLTLGDIDIRAKAKGVYVLSALNPRTARD